MTFHDIFSTKKDLHASKVQTVIIDIHEKNSLVPAELSKLNIPFVFESLKVGDYLINNTLIERKTLSDLQSSIISKRIFEQIKNLQQSPSPMIIIESSTEKKLILHENALRGFFLSLIQEHKIPFILTDSERDTAHYFSLLARTKSPSQISLRPSRLLETREEQLQFILEGFPGIGPVAAKALLNKFHSLKNIFNAQEPELEDILGKKTNEFKSLIE